MLHYWVRIILTNVNSFYVSDYTDDYEIILSYRNCMGIWFWWWEMASKLVKFKLSPKWAHIGNIYYWEGEFKICEWSQCSVFYRIRDLWSYTVSRGFYLILSLIGWFRTVFGSSKVNPLLNSYSFWASVIVYRSWEIFLVF